MNNLDDIDLIEKYLTKRMNDQEIRKIENRLHKDRPFRLLKEEMEMLISGIKKGAARTTREEKLVKLKDTLSDETDDEKSIENNTPKIRRLPFAQRTFIRRFAYVATFLLLIGAISFVIIKNEMQSGESIYMAYLDNRESGYEPLRGGAPDHTIRARAYTAYENKSYQGAIPYFKEILSENENDLDATLFLGISQMFAGDTHSAMPLLQKLATHPDYMYTEVPKYYLSLLYIKEEKYEQATPLLEDVIRGNEESLAKKSRKILRKID